MSQLGSCGLVFRTETQEEADRLEREAGIEKDSEGKVI